MSAARLSAARATADQAACHALLNCLVKEFALPLALADEGCLRRPLGLPFQLYRRLQSPDVVPLPVRMPDGVRFVVLADRKDSLGSQSYRSAVFGKRPGEGWRMLTPALLARFMLDSCAAITKERNPELLEQILASRDLKRAVTAHFAGRAPAPLADYLRSEQCLWYGHPAQVAPKARLWPASLPQEEVSPEFGAALRLHLFDVPADGLWVAANGLSRQQALDAFADQDGAAAGHVRISMHPIQAELFLADPRVQGLLKAGRIRDLGRGGFLSHPTASVRTMYVKEHGYFIKGSLNVRITNCVRKNAWYELESALLIDRLLARLVHEQPGTTGGLEVVAEPAALSWSPDGCSEADRIWFREQTGAILRRNFCLDEGEGQCLLAGTVFGRDLALRSNVLVFLEHHLGRAPSERDLLEWFAAYAALLLRPVLAMFFHHGVIFEPHLQNTVLVHRRGQPRKLLLRDFEGVKLSAEHGMREVPQETHERVRQSMAYPRAQGWKRIAYCLFVNNLSEAVLALTQGRPGLAPAMWRQVRRQLQDIRAELQAPAPELDELLAGAAIPCKANFRIRLAAAADRFAGYVDLRAPWETLQ
ncbi:IucA/IucC family protein [Massilia sp. DD77]|uniref:IucA/IucC family protein n=1 Tax=Massilia sp. DD77 TaxID=3109349 RepID=UPI0030003E6B